MARLTRLAIAGQLHHVALRGHSGIQGGGDCGTEPDKFPGGFLAKFAPGGVDIIGKWDHDLANFDAHRKLSPTQASVSPMVAPEAKCHHAPMPEPPVDPAPADPAVPASWTRTPRIRMRDSTSSASA